MGACVVCTQQFDDDALLFGDRGPTCAPCMVAADERAETTKQLWTLVIAPPVVAVLGGVALCIPLIGLFISLLMSCVALFGGLSAIQKGYRLEPEDDVAPEMKNYLLASGVLTTVVSIGSTGLLVMMSIAVVVSMAL